jgi:hypothetical protein
MPLEKLHNDGKLDLNANLTWLPCWIPTLCCWITQKGWKMERGATALYADTTYLYDGRTLKTESYHVGGPRFSRQPSYGVGGQMRGARLARVPEHGSGTLEQGDNSVLCWHFKCIALYPKDQESGITVRASIRPHSNPLALCNFNLLHLHQSIRLPEHRIRLFTLVMYLSAIPNGKVCRVRS